MKTTTTKKAISHLVTAMRIAAATATMAFSMAVYMSSIANAALLKSDVTVYEDQITLGDVFEGIENNRNAGYVLGPAPKPGDNIVLNTSTLRKLAKAIRLT